MSPVFSQDFLERVYNKPWIRAVPYLMGMLVSLIYKIRLSAPQDKTFIESMNLARYLMYLAGTLLILLTISFPYFFKNLETSSFTIILMSTT